MLKSVIILIILGGFTAASAWWYIQLPTLKADEVVVDAWNLPPLPSAERVAQAAVKLRQLHPWKIDEVVTPLAAVPPAAEAAKPATPAPVINPKRDWQLMGIVERGEQRYVLVLDKEGKIKPYSVKNLLPNGSLLLSIQNDFIEIVLKDGKREKVELYE